jgi:hypothetical protein
MSETGWLLAGLLVLVGGAMVVMARRPHKG